MTPSPFMPTLPLALFSMRFSKSCNLALKLAIDSFCSLALMSLNPWMHKLNQPTRRKWFFWHCHSSTPGSIPQLAYSWYQVSTSSHSALKGQPKIGGEGAFSFLAWFLQKSPELIRHSKSVSRTLINVYIYPTALNVRLALLSMTPAKRSTNSSW